MLWRWLTIVGLSVTPNLVVGQSIAAYLGIKWGMTPWILLAVMAAAGYAEGVGVAWLAGRSTNIGFVHRWVVRMRKPKAIAFANKWGVWGGMTIGVALVGQEPILIALRWLDVEMRRLWFPLAIGNLGSAILYYEIWKLGMMTAPGWI